MTKSVNESSAQLYEFRCTHSQHSSLTIRILVFLNYISSTAHTGMGDATVILLCVASANTNSISNRIILLVLLMLKHNSINTNKVI